MNVHQTLFGDERFKPFVLLHEFGHYAYGVYDEYSGPSADDGLSCVGGSTSDACIMETAWDEGDRFGNAAAGGTLVLGRVSEFCVASNHDPNRDTYQSTINHQSCWETMVAAFPGLSLPSGTPTANAPSGAGTITWTLLKEEQWFALVLDCSGSMAGPKISETRIGADWWADSTQVGDRLGIVSYSDTAKVDFPLQVVDSDAVRNTAHTAISSLVAAGRTAIGAGLRTAFDQFNSAGLNAATQVIVLVSDGLHNSGESPDAVLPDLQSNGIRVYTLGVGSDIDSVLLSKVATTTGGIFYRIDPLLSAEEQAFEIRTRLQEISAIARENGGVVTSFREKVTESNVVKRVIHVESNCDVATFGYSQKNPRDNLFIRLYAPDGTGMDDSSSGVQFLHSRGRYMAYQVPTPQAGDWTIEVYDEGIQSPGGAEFQAFVFSQNPTIDGGLSSPRIYYDKGEDITLGLQSYYSQPLTGLKVTAIARRTFGDVRILLDFRDDGTLASGDPMAGDGMYHATFQSLYPGVYVVEAVVTNDGGARYCDRGERLLKGETFTHPPIPTFVRRFTLSLLIGDDPTPHIRIHPDQGRPGERVDVEVSGWNTLFQNDETLARFGQGVRVTAVDVQGNDKVVASIVIDRDAIPGFRDVEVSTQLWQEFLNLSNGFRILCPSVAMSLPEPTLSPQAHRRRLVEQLIYDSDGMFVGIRLERNAVVIKVSSGLEAVFKEARVTRTRVTLISDERTGDVVAVEIG